MADANIKPPFWLKPMNKVFMFMLRLGLPISGKEGPVVLTVPGRKSGQPRRTAVGGKVVDNQFWMVSEHGDHSDYVRNIKANPGVRVRLGGQWRNGTAHLLPDDDPLQRLGNLPRLNSAVVRMMGSELLTIRVDLA